MLGAVVVPTLVRMLFESPGYDKEKKGQAQRNASQVAYPSSFLRLSRLLSLVLYGS